MSRGLPVIVFAIGSFAMAAVAWRAEQGQGPMFYRRKVEAGGAIYRWTLIVSGSCALVVGLVSIVTG